MKLEELRKEIKNVYEIVRKDEGSKSVYYVEYDENEEQLIGCYYGSPNGTVCNRYVEFTSDEGNVDDKLHEYAMDMAEDVLNSDCDDEEELFIDTNNGTYYIYSGVICKL